MKVLFLVNTSVDDMRSSLQCDKDNGDLDIDVLRQALEIVTERGEKTKAKILQSYINKLEKAADEERKLRLLQKAYE